MAIQVTCTSCGKKLQVQDSAAGKRAKCPHCSAIVQIPELTPPSNIFDAEETPFGDLGSPGGSFPAANSFPQTPTNFPAVSGPGSLGEKPCPMCGEMIKSNAVKCRYCGEIFDSALKKQAKKSSSAGGTDSEMSTGDWVVAILCSGIGCIAGIIWMIQGKPKGLKMFGVSLGMQFFWGFIRVIIEIAANQ